MLNKRKISIPSILQDPSLVYFKEEKELPVDPEIKKQFSLSSHFSLLSCYQDKKKEEKPLKVAVVFSGGPASGGHNVLAALFDTLKKLHPQSQLLGFLDGPKAIIEGNTKEITEKELEPYRNQGGFDLLGTGRDKIEKEEELEKALQVTKKLQLDAIVIIGGDDSNTNAAILADYFLKHKSQTKVIGVPKTIDGDLASKYTPISFGFDTATKVYAEMVGNLARDAISSRKYYHFVKLMGRSASHVTLECALKTQPNLTFLSEEKKSLKTVVDEIVNLVNERAKLNKNWGVILIPEGLIEFMPEVAALLKELSIKKVEELSSSSKEVWQSLPESIQKQLLLGKDPHGNINVSAIETEKLLINMVSERVKVPFSAIPHFFGYEGRCAMPSNFDANYCYTLGSVAALLIARGYTSYMCSVTDLDKNPKEWKLGAVPLTSLMHFEERRGKRKAVIAKTLVDLKAGAYLHYQNNKEKWKLNDHYLYPGPMQFFAEERDVCPEII